MGYFTQLIWRFRSQKGMQTNLETAYRRQIVKNRWFSVKNCISVSSTLKNIDLLCYWSPLVLDSICGRYISNRIKCINTKPFYLQVSGLNFYNCTHFMCCCSRLMGRRNVFSLPLWRKRRSRGENDLSDVRKALIFTQSFFVGTEMRTWVHAISGQSLHRLQMSWAVASICFQIQQEDVPFLNTVPAFVLPANGVRGIGWLHIGELFEHGSTDRAQHVFYAQVCHSVFRFVW